MDTSNQALSPLAILLSPCDDFFAFVPKVFVPCLSLFYLLHNVKSSITVVGKYGVALSLEGDEVVDNSRAKEKFTIGKGGFINNYLGALDFDELHNALDGTLTRETEVLLHSNKKDANDQDVDIPISDLAIEGGKKVLLLLGHIY